MYYIVRKIREIVNVKVKKDLTRELDLDLLRVFSLSVARTIFNKFVFFRNEFLRIAVVFNSSFMHLE